MLTLIIADNNYKRVSILELTRIEVLCGDTFNDDNLPLNLV